MRKVAVEGKNTEAKYLGENKEGREWGPTSYSQYSFKIFVDGFALTFLGR
jgi:hypothetical protein